jgi:hypothetical protein
MVEGVKMGENDREIRIGKSILYFGEDNIFYVTVVGEWDKKTAIAIQEANIKFRELVEGKMNIFVDLNRAGKQSPEARKMGKELIKHETVGKVALFGLHPVARVIAYFFKGFVKKKDLRFFKTKEEALTWLKMPKRDE